MHRLGLRLAPALERGTWEEAQDGVSESQIRYFQDVISELLKLAELTALRGLYSVGRK